MPDKPKARRKAHRRPHRPARKPKPINIGQLVNYYRIRKLLMQMQALEEEENCCTNDCFQLPTDHFITALPCRC